MQQGKPVDSALDLIIEDIQSQATNAKTKMRASNEANSAGAQFNREQKEELNKIAQFQQSVQQMASQNKVAELCANRGVINKAIDDAH